MKKQSLKKSWLKTNSALSILLMVCLMLTSSKVKAQTNLLPEPQPSGFVYLDKHEQSTFSKYIKSCELDKANLKSYERAYNICAEKHQISPEWWQTEWGVVGIGFSTFLVGLVIGAAK